MPGNQRVQGMPVRSPGRPGRAGVWMRSFCYAEREDRFQATVTKTDWLLKQFGNLNVWRRGDERAPHKPLLVLYALGQVQAGADRLIPFDRIEEPLTRLLEDFGPPRRSAHPELPFYHLQTDGVWDLEERVPLTRRRARVFRKVPPRIPKEPAT